MTTKYPFDEQVDKKWRSKVTFMGYTSSGPSKKPPVGNIPDQITKYYSCGMVQDTRNGPRKQYQQKRGTETATKEENAKQQKKGSGGVKREKKIPISGKIKCCGTSIATY